jgi:hypothetical protein
MTNSFFELFVSHTLAKGFETLLRYMAATERQLNRAIVRLRETQVERRKSQATQPAHVKVMSATSYGPSQFVSSTSNETSGPENAELTTDHRLLTTGSAELTPTADN